MLAEAQAMHLLDMNLNQDFGLFDGVGLQMTMPPMIGANNPDGKIRLVLGDMNATFSDHGKPMVSAAINAQIDLEIVAGSQKNQLALQFGKTDFVINVLSDNTGMLGGADVTGATSTGIGLQLDSLKQFLITLPMPSIAGVTLDNLTLHADSGYILFAGDVH